MLNSVKKNKTLGVVVIILLLLILDQLLKFWVKTHMHLYESIEITSWFYISFTENPGMAFGIELVDKLLLTIFRIIAVIFIGYYIYTLINRNYRFGFLVAVSLIFTGALGNIIDCVFYGVIFDTSYGQLATLFPAGGGYGEWMHGKVVDMFYFPLIKTVLPEWLPLWGGEEFIFFRPIFNLADSFITVGMFLLILFFRHDFSESLSKKKPDVA